MGLALLSASEPRGQEPLGPDEAGRVHLFQDGDTSFERWVHSPGCARHVARYYRMRLYSPFADRCVQGGYRGALSYHDAQAIYPVELRPRRGDSRRTRRNRRLLDRWILRDARGRRLHVPYDCRQGRCPQYAADIGNPRFRQRIVGKIRRVLKRGYRGVFFDDVNWNLNVSDGQGRPRTPINPRTGLPMTLDVWQRHMAKFVEEVRAAAGTREVMINSVWWRDEASLSDPQVLRGVSAATHYEMERGTDDVFRGQSYDEMLATIDRLHGLGLGVNLDNYRATTRRQAEFELGTYFLVSEGRDSLNADYGSCPDNRAGSPCEEPFWSGYTIRLGPPRGPRARREDGLLERRFGRGLVLVNPPGAAMRRVTLDGVYTDLDGVPRLVVTLEGGQAMVLKR